MTTYVPRGPRNPRDILEFFIWVEYVPRGHRTPRDILESFIWVKGGHRASLIHSMMKYVLRGPRTLGTYFIMEWVEQGLGHPMMPFDPYE